MVNFLQMLTIRVFLSAILHFSLKWFRRIKNFCILFSNEGEKFYGELDNFELRMPGNQSIPFSDNENVLEWARKQYPNWRERGKVTSVPVARVPKMFLENFQIEKQLQKKLKSTIKGEDAEKKLYRLFVEGFFKEQPGMIVFPNVDGSLIFNSKVGKVEVDMVLIHPQKGIFVFNVKNEGSFNSKIKNMEKKIAEVRADIKKHTTFIRMLKDYNSVGNITNVPINSVVCDFANNQSKFATFKKEPTGTEGKIIVFEMDGLKKVNFAHNWCSQIKEVDDVKWDDSFDLLIARLIALASFEGAAVLINERMKAGLLQSVPKSDYLKAQLQPHKVQLEPHSSAKGFEETVTELSKIEVPKKKEAFILWTKDQTKIIAHVYSYLAQPQSSTGLRILVTGGKGSGKTVLLVFLSKLAQCLMEAEEKTFEQSTAGSVEKYLQQEPQNESKMKRIFVCHGDRNCCSLTQALREALKGIEVTVDDLQGKSNTSLYLI